MDEIIYEVFKVQYDFALEVWDSICACHKFCFEACLLDCHKVKACIFPKIMFRTNFVILSIQKFE